MKSNNTTTVIIVSLLALLAVGLYAAFYLADGEPGAPTARSRTAATAPLPPVNLRHRRQPPGSTPAASTNENPAGGGQGSAILDNRPSPLADEGNEEDQDHDAPRHFSKEYDPEMLQKELEYALQLEDPQARRQALIALGGILAPDYLDVAFELLAQLEEPAEQLILGITVINAMLGVDPEAAANWAEQTPEHIKSAAYGKIASAWARRDPKAAVEWSKLITEPKLRYTVLDEITLSWAAKDMDATYNWAVTIDDPEAQKRVFNKMGIALARQDPTAAAQWALDFEDNATRYSILNFAISQWAKKDLPASITWTEALPEGPNKTIATKKIIEAWTQKDPVAATNWTATLPEGNTKTSAVNNALFYWTNKDPLPAFQWVSSLEDADKAKNRAFHTVVRTWALKNVQDASSWVATIPDPELRKKMEQVVQQVIDRQQAAQKQ